MRPNSRANDPNITGRHRDLKPRRQSHGDGESTDDPIDGGNTGRFGQGMPRQGGYPNSYQNDPRLRQRTQAPGGGAAPGSYQGRPGNDMAGASPYPPAAPTGGSPDWNNLSQTTRMQALVKAIRNRLMVTANNRGK